MAKLLAHCGLDCSKCDAYLLRNEKDVALRSAAAKKWEKLYGYSDLKPENIACDGCLSETGRVFFNCNICPIRMCANERKVVHCSECEDFPCENIKKFHANHPDAKRNLELLSK
jgi:hypothetical protein